MKGRLRLVVLGMMGRAPFGGQTWLYINWLRGLAALGHEVWYVEDDIVWPFDPLRYAVADDFSYAVSHVGQVMERIGMADRWVYRFVLQPDACWGPGAARVDELYRSCDALLNIVGATELRDEHLVAPYRVYVETDPVTRELWMANGEEKSRLALGEHHHVIATYGENYGAADCGVPLNGLDAKYRKTRQPVDLELWPMAFDEHAELFTTIGNWKQEGKDIPYAGEVYRWSKHHEWERFIDLPSRTGQRFQIALKTTHDKAHEWEEELGGEAGQRLTRYGWSPISPVRMSLDVFGAYPEFIRRSRAEWTVAKDQNVRLRSGWFSERDACYLASGKPVVAQDTGFSKILPTGEGLFAFTTMEESLAAIDAINSDYRRHCLAARAIAEDYFEARKVAGRLLADVGLS